MASIDMTQAEAFQSESIKYSDRLIGKLHFADTDDYTVHTNVKDKEVLNLIEVKQIVKRYTEPFSADADRIVILPKKAEVEKMSVELNIVPKKFESNYLARYRKPGQDDDFIPFEVYIMEQLFARKNSEISNADINGVKTATPSATDPADQIYDGVLEQARKEIAAGLTPFAVPGGVINQSNILSVLDGMEDRYSDALDTEEDMLFRMEPRLIRAFQKAWKADGNTGNVPEKNAKGWVRNEFGTGWLVPKPKMRGSNTIVLTNPGNIHLFIDLETDGNVFSFQRAHRGIDMWTDFNRGLKIALAYDDTFVVTDTVLP